jgi:[CysO sulfur-carrier protein]-S-L-cysteine hydrolase
MLRMTERQMEQIVCHAASESPLEVCGLLAGLNNIVMHIYPIKNVAPDPAKAFRMEQLEQIYAMLEIDDRQLDLLAIYHSHPPGAMAWPSRTDIAEANYPDVTTVILAATPDGAWISGAFTLREGRVTELGLEIR